jgi:hypothetical protein
MGAAIQIPIYQTRQPEDPNKKVIFGILGASALATVGVDYLTNANEAGNQFGGLTTYTAMAHPTMVNNLGTSFTDPSSYLLSAPADTHSACGVICVGPQQIMTSGTGHTTSSTGLQTYVKPNGAVVDSAGHLISGATH